MQRKTLLATGLAVLIAGAASLAVAQTAPPAPKPAPAAKAPSPGDDGMLDFVDGGHGMHHPGFDGPGMGGPGMGMDGRGSPVVNDLRALEHIYLATGRSKELTALYNDVLSKSQDPRVRTYVYHQLAHVQMMPANPDQAIATLRKSLDENLANEAKRRAEFDKMRSEWEQRHAQPKPGSTPPSKP